MLPVPSRPPEATLTLQHLASIYCVSTRTIWRWVAQGKLPPPIAVTRRTRRWIADEIQAHLDELRRRGR